MTQKELETIRTYIDSPSPSVPLQYALRKLLQKYQSTQELESKLKKSVDVLNFYANVASEALDRMGIGEPNVDPFLFPEKFGTRAKQALKQIKGD